MYFYNLLHEMLVKYDFSDSRLTKWKSREKSAIYINSWKFWSQKISKAELINKYRNTSLSNLQCAKEISALQQWLCRKPDEIAWWKKVMEHHFQWIFSVILTVIFFSKMNWISSVHVHIICVQCQILMYSKWLEDWLKA